VLRLQSFFRLDQLELDGFAVFEAPETFALDAGIVNVNPYPFLLSNHLTVPTSMARTSMAPANEMNQQSARDPGPVTVQQVDQGESPVDPNLAGPLHSF